MDLVNRLIVTLLAVAMVIAGGFVVGATAGWLAPAALAQSPELARLAVSLQDLPGMTSFWMGAGGGTALAAGLILLWLEVRPRRRERVLVLQRDRTGEVTVSLIGLKRLADFVVGELPGVETVSSEARAGREGVQFNCRLQVKPDANTPALADAIRNRLSSAVEAHVGLPATTIHIHTRVGDPSNGKRRVR
jgi:hypothetical protein